MKTQTLSEAFIDYFKEQVESAFDTYNLGSNTTVDFHNEHYRNANADVDVTIVMAAGQIQQNVVQYPVQILVQVKEGIDAKVREALEYIATSKNSNVITLNVGGDDKEYRTFYAAPSILQNFENNGLNKRCVLSMDATIFTFNNVADIKSITLTTTYNETSYSEEVAFLSCAFNYMAQTNAMGGTTTSKNTQVGETCATSVSLYFIPKNNGIFYPLRKMMFLNTLVNQQFKCKIVFNSDSDTTEELTTIVNQCAYAKDDASFPNVQLTLVRSA